MKLIAGLGNPGAGYADTYHNMGFIALDVIAERFGVSFYKPGYAGKFPSVVADVKLGGENVLLVKPQTYMNLSGDAIGGISRYLKIEPRDILVIYDDIDIKKGTVRARLNGSAGTHNGMRDIVDKLGSQDFARVRIGTGLKPDYMALVDYVLAHMTAAEKPTLLSAAQLAAGLAVDWAEGKTWQDLTVTVQ